MWLPTPSVETITRPRLAVAVVSAVAAASVGYYAYQIHRDQADLQSGAGLHRSNAVRRQRRPLIDEPDSGTPSESPGDENIDAGPPLRPTPADGETVVEGGPDDWWNDPGGFPSSQRAGHNIVNLLFRVSEDNARRNGCVHRGCQCNSCGMVPIRGVRYRCVNCADFDLCETCEAQGVHTKTHIFYKIRVPAPPFAPRQMQPVWYTGDPDSYRRSLPRSLLPKLTRVSGFERPELEAFWEQWTFMACTEWRDDPDELCLAMDRKTFERCLVPTGGSRHAAPNLIHDRMFTFYDQNGDDLIDFTEFLQGLSYRKRKDKLRKVFEGYDIDGDGFVDRRDFLRMFRAYYVLFKQMHKDLLDGMEDQLLASTEAQQLVTSRQPLSSLFGREGSVPRADGGLRVDGKTYRRDGSVDVADGHENAVVDDRAEVSSRREILTSLFACEADEAPQWYVAGSDGDNNWRVVRRLSRNNTNESYWVTLLDPPTRREELPYVGSRTFRDHEMSSIDSREEEPTFDEDGDPDADDALDSLAPGVMPTESEARARFIEHGLERAPRLEKRRRDMARARLHDRWRRRQFYLDEEEGGDAPDGWEDDEDLLRDLRELAEDSKAAENSMARSRSSSKVRFVEDIDDLDVRSNPSTSSRSIPERWGGMEIPMAEKDAGREILYQVTQQAFNELLDTLFKPSEDLAVQAAETKAPRELFKEQIAAYEPQEGEPVQPEVPEEKVVVRSDELPIKDKSLPQLLAESGYSIAAEPRNAVDLDGEVDILEVEEVPRPCRVPEDYDNDIRDPTMPQFRPDSQAFMTSSMNAGPSYPITDEGHDFDQPRAAFTIPDEPTPEMLQWWKTIAEAEARAEKRGGWGRLSFEEFEEVYKSQEDQGNRLDYLGSWIEFCIP